MLQPTAMYVGISRLDTNNLHHIHSMLRFLPFDKVGLYCFLVLIFWSGWWKQIAPSVSSSDSQEGLEWWQVYSRVYAAPDGVLSLKVQNYDEFQNAWSTGTQQSSAVFISLTNSINISTMHLPKGQTIYIHGEVENIVVGTMMEHLKESTCNSSTLNRLFDVEGSLVLSNLKLQGYTPKSQCGNHARPQRLDDESTYSGGGVICRQGSSITMTGCMIAGNESPTSFTFL